MNPAPTIGRIVHFRSRTGKYTVPAIITCTVHTANPDSLERGTLPLFSRTSSVHLTVFTPGLPPAGIGSRANADDFIAPPTAQRHVYGPLHVNGEPTGGNGVLGFQPVPVGENLGGTYQEWDVPFWDPAADDTYSELWDGIYLFQDAGSWTWPPRV